MILKMYEAKENLIENELMMEYNLDSLNLKQRVCHKNCCWNPYFKF